MANILVVHGSPRKGGNSQILAEAFMEGAREAGNDVQFESVGLANIAGCKACEYCFSHEGVCIQKDDMQPLYDKLRWADVLVYAFPMYYYTYPTQIKAFMDRMFCGIGKPFGITKNVLLLCFEDKDITTADGLIKSFEIASNYVKQVTLGMVVVNNVYAKGAIEGNPGLDEARKLGASIS